MTIAKGRYRRIPIIAAKVAWKDLHPVPRIAVPDKNCCDCVFLLSASTNPASNIGGVCNLTGSAMNPYDECGAFSKKQIPIEKSTP